MTHILPKTNDFKNRANDKGSLLAFEDSIITKKSRVRSNFDSISGKDHLFEEISRLSRVANLTERTTYINSFTCTLIVISINVSLEVLRLYNLLRSVNKRFHSRNFLRI